MIENAAQQPPATAEALPPEALPATARTAAQAGGAGSGGRPGAGPRAVDAQSVALVSVFAALVVAASVLPGVPVGALGVPITLQTFAVMLTGLVLGPLRGSLAVLVYLLVGFVGLPVFSQGASGLQVLAGPSAGYLVSFVLAALVVGLLARAVVRRAPAGRWVPLFFAAAMLASVAIVHALGIAGLMVNGKLTLAAAFRVDLAFYPGDIVKNVVAALAAAAVHRAFPDILVRRPARSS
ncbi:biotin operon repressor [Intrasporangium oryzae NRRL B-24470]|uniref:Biotin operon repressor n=1 Tax=Intrasporangium oryzae NRRL B-24470 TaxID=1386089 RepID=W9G3C4_9MICO|nr:biotin transporter BioY [Intrasporangium oryzae]EWT00485.1 biotin operon repressor [Intrasporangium oryzae NRRL B-24470]